MVVAAQAFRHYDIRGNINQDIFIDDTYTLGRAVAEYVLQQNPQAKTIIIGRDGRTHSPAIQKNIAQAFFDVGFTVHDTGVCPTPVVYFATHVRDYDAAVMVTASHNGPEYNGLKLCLGKNSIWGTQIQKIKELYYAALENNCLHARVMHNNASYKRVNVQRQYAEYMAREFVDLKNLTMPIIADCGNGAVGALLRQVVDAVGLREVTIMCEEVDGTYPNHAANPVELENMLHVIQAVDTHKPAFAVGFDGDGDRMAAVTPDGKLVCGDVLLALFAQDILQKNKQGTIVYDGKCSLIVAETIAQHAGAGVRSPSGHSIIKSVMREHNALFGGELSCHFFFADTYFGFDDGVYAFLRLVRLMSSTSKDLTQLVQEFSQTFSTPEIRIPCSDTEKYTVIEKIKEVLRSQDRYTLSYQDGVRLEDAQSWALIRVSNTQPAVCIRCESLTDAGLQAIKKVIYDALGSPGAMPIVPIQASDMKIVQELS
ncbi:MAG: phosphomannomutase/phosphoglucomutase [Candidatus Babeliaceae bacterium]|nr:phosphomannomutase/phosphoglucomutase [Candidatus Babeliaceae bacterium]